MRAVTPTGEVIELGTVETAPTIGIVDRSRRVTDDFGVTTVVERGFSRRMSVRLGVPFDYVDELQRQLADLRATPVRWIADDRYDWLSAQGFYKDFSIDLATRPLSLCTLTVEGLAASEAFVDAGGDPAPEGQPSTLQLLQPVIVTDAILAASSVAENDAPEWVAATTYPKGARVVKAATHRVYESVVGGNVGDDPAASSGKWLDLGPTNRWAMFDQALGSTTSAAGAIVVTLSAGAVDAVALLDVTGATVRVQAAGYDRTVPVGSGAITFLDLPKASGPVTVTITGSGQVSVGTLLIGSMAALGVTEASPTAGITDYSRKEIDDFGAATVVQRAWAKRMTTAALIRTDALDMVANRIAAVRARPSLWIGEAGLDSLTVYGFFKDFSIEVGENVSKLSLSIEGLSKAAKVGSLLTSVAWPDVTDPDGTKPADNADVTGDHTSKDTNAVGGRPVGEVLQHLTTIDEAIENVRESIEGVEAGSTQAALDARDAAIAAAGNSTTARDQSQAARDAAQAAQQDAHTNALASARSAADANGFAVTADARADTAIQKADAAGQSAISASASERTASTKAGEATASATEAATSEKNASGSATAAYRSSQVSASSAVASVQSANAPISFAQRGALYTEFPWADAPAALPDSDFVAAANGFVCVKTAAFTIGYAKLLPGKGRLYRYQTKLRAVGADGVYSANYEASNTRAGFETGNFAGFLALPVSAGWKTIDFLIDMRADVWAFVNAHLTGSPGAGGSIEVEYLRCLDITDQQVAEDSAKAAADSSSSAATKADQAGQSASAADRSATNAGTAASQASTFRDQASTSQRDAAGSAAAATQQAGLAARSADAAGGSATAANTSAGTASTKADAAGASASAANASAQTAEGHRGAAESAAHAAQGSAAAADGAVASASSYANLSAQRADAAGSSAAAAKSSADAAASSSGALSQQVDRVEATANGASADASFARQAVVDVKTGLAGARLTLAAVSPGGRAQFTLTSDNNNGASWELVGNGRISGDLTIDGTLRPLKFDRSSMSREGFASWSGFISPNAGQTQGVPWSLALSTIPPLGRFLYEFAFDLATNAGQQDATTYNGRPAYTNYVDAGGGLSVVAYDAQGNAYPAVANASTSVAAVTDFAPTWSASVTRGNTNTSWINEGDYYRREVAATYTLTALRLKVTWVAI